MALVNRCGFRAASGGTADFVFASEIAGLFKPADATNPAIADATQYHYVAESDDGDQVEIGLGTWTNGTLTLSRDTVYQSTSVAPAKVNFSEAPAVRITALAQDFTSSGVEVQDEGVTDVAAATVLNFTGAGVSVSDVGGVATVNVPGGGGGGLTSETITTGASPVAADPEVNITYITSGGTGGDEIVTLGDPQPYKADGFSNPEQAGFIKTFIIDGALTNPGDAVKVQRTSGQFIAEDANGNPIGRTDELVLDFDDASATVQWGTYDWLFTGDLNYNNSTTLTDKVGYVPSIPAGDQRILLSGSGSSNWSGDLGVVNSVVFVQTGAAPVDASTNYHQNLILTGGTAGTEVLALAAPDAGQIGARLNIRTVYLGNVSDVLSVDVTNIRDAAGGALVSIVSSAVNEYVCLIAYSTSEWRVASDVAQTMTIT